MSLLNNRVLNRNTKEHILCPLLFQVTEGTCSHQIENSVFNKHERLLMSFQVFKSYITIGANLGFYLLQTFQQINQLSKQQIAEFSCETPNLIYVIICNSCSKEYIVQTGDSLKRDLKRTDSTFDNLNMKK